MHVPFAQKEQNLLLCEGRIDASERHHVECEIPSRKPRVFPFVRHRDDVTTMDMPPILVPSALVAVGRRGLIRIALEPVLDDVVVKLLAPEQAGVCLARNRALFGSRSGGCAVLVESVGVVVSLREGSVEFGL